MSSFFYRACPLLVALCAFALLLACTEFPKQALPSFNHEDHTGRIKKILRARYKNIQQYAPMPTQALQAMPPEACKDCWVLGGYGLSSPLAEQPYKLVVLPQRNPGGQLCLEVRLFLPEETTIHPHHVRCQILGAEVTDQEGRRVELLTTTVPVYSDAISEKAASGMAVLSDERPERQAYDYDYEPNIPEGLQLFRFLIPILHESTCRLPLQGKVQVALQVFHYELAAQFDANLQNVTKDNGAHDITLLRAENNQAVFDLHYNSATHEFMVYATNAEGQLLLPADGPVFTAKEVQNSFVSDREDAFFKQNPKATLEEYLALMLPIYERGFPNDSTFLKKELGEIHQVQRVYDTQQFISFYEFGTQAPLIKTCSLIADY